MNIFQSNSMYIRTLIKDTIETYSGQWRLIHESIQNSHDSIQRRQGGTEGHIHIDMFVGSNKVVVRDDGTGIPISKFDSLFQLGATDKKEEEFRRILKGSQGVGIKATIFSSTYFRVATAHSTGSWSIEVNDFYRYFEEEFDGDVPDPQVDAQSPNETGTEVAYQLHDYSVSDFLHEVAEEYCRELSIEFLERESDLLEALKVYFQTNTYLGCLSALFGMIEERKNITVSFSLHLDYGTLEEHRQASFPYSPFLNQDAYHGTILRRSFPANYCDFDVTHSALDQHNKADVLYTHISEVLERPTPLERRKLLIQKFTPEQARYLIGNIRKDRVTNQHRLELDDAAIAKHAPFLNKLNSVYLIVGPRQYLNHHLHLAPKQSIAVNGLPTNISLNPPRGAGELGYLPNIHLIVDIDTTLGYGKKNIPARTKGQADAFFGDAWSILRRVARAVVGERDAVEPTGRLLDKEQALAQYSDPANPIRPLDLPSKLIPQEEQDVIALFHQLIGDGRLSGYYPFRSSVDTVYDGLMYISMDMPPQMRSPVTLRDLKNVEFKLLLSQMIKDLEDGSNKVLGEMDLVIVWEDDYNGDSDFIVTSLSRDQIEPYPGAQKRIRLGNNQCQVLVLREFLGLSR